MTSMNKVFANLPVTIFEAMSQLARDNNAINLGQGFPDDPGPEDIRRAAADVQLHPIDQPQPAAGWQPIHRTCQQVRDKYAETCDFRHPVLLRSPPPTSTSSQC